MQFGTGEIKQVETLQLPKNEQEPLHCHSKLDALHLVSRPPGTNISDMWSLEGNAPKESSQRRGASGARNSSGCEHALSAEPKGIQLEARRMGIQSFLSFSFRTSGLWERRRRAPPTMNVSINQHRRATHSVTKRRQWGDGRRRGKGAEGRWLLRKERKKE